MWFRFRQTDLNLISTVSDKFGHDGVAIVTKIPVCILHAKINRVTRLDLIRRSTVCLPLRCLFTFPRFTLQSIDDCGHWVHAEKPQ